MSLSCLDAMGVGLFIVNFFPLFFHCLLCFCLKKNRKGDLAQLVERTVRIGKARGSKPRISNYSFFQSKRELYTTQLLMHTLLPPLRIENSNNMKLLSSKQTKKQMAWLIRED